MSRRRGTLIDRNWPAWRYGPYGESAVFQSEAEVPPGWASKPQDAYVPVTKEKPNRDHLIGQLIDRGVKPLGHWSVSYMQELLNQ